MTMFEASDITVRYGSGARSLTAVDRLSVTIPRGGTVGLVGESGSGKSTFGKALVGLIRTAGGTIKLDGEDYTEHRARTTAAFRSRVQMVFQDPYASLNPRMTVEQMLGDAVRLAPRESRGDVSKEVRAALEMVGLPGSSAERYPHEFSGGQRQRVAIARALAVKPSMIIHDEVTSALDVSVQASILNLLRDLQDELGLTYLLISHDLAVVRQMSDSIVVMYLGRGVEEAEVDAFFAAPTHPYSRALLASIPEVGQERRSAPLGGDLPDPFSPPPGCRFHTRCPEGPAICSGREICRTDDPVEIADGKLHHAACHFAAPGTVGSANSNRSGVSH